MTPPSYGWLTMRDAALSLALRHKFAGALANPRQMEPYSYAKSPITMPDDENFLTVVQNLEQLLRTIFV